MAAKVGSGGDEGDAGDASASGVSVSGSDASASAAGSGASASSESLGYEQARDELIDVVRRLEAGGTTLEESLALWERGEALAKVCRRWLEGARARLDAALEAEG
ncbi:exodeoxyribonuclease VII small subunit [Streptomyces melanogenes]|uniref:exodeoxyribonuclease VII small subunit n=1 Tax=Streptomyces melanogenes TaxID=67326 RepID=UPI0037A11A0A